MAHSSTSAPSLPLLPLYKHIACNDIIDENLASDPPPPYLASQMADDDNSQAADVQPLLTVSFGGLGLSILYRDFPFSTRTIVFGTIIILGFLDFVYIYLWMGPKKG